MTQNSYKLLLAQQILKLYEITVTAIAEPQTGYRNYSFEVVTSDNTKLNLILFKNEPRIIARIGRADRASELLARSDLPVRVRIDQRIVAIKQSPEFGYAGLYNYLPGKTIEWDSYTKDHLKVLGMAMARMHKVFQNISLEKISGQKAASLSMYDECNTLVEQIEDYFSQDSVVRAAENKLNVRLIVDYERFRAAINVGQELRLQHALHMDFVRGNILFSVLPTAQAISYGKAHMTGIIDFEKTAFGSPLFDLARTLAFLYVDCKYKTTEKIKKYFLYSGYVKHGDSVVESSKLLERYIQFFLLHDFYKFLLHNPYEYLDQNEHYLRTRDILIRQNMVEYKP